MTKLQILFNNITILRKRDASKDIQIYLNSPGGSVYAGLDLWHDAHQARRCYNLYRNGSFYGSGVVMCSTKTFCFATFKSNDSPTRRSSRVATDMEINLREMLKLKDELYKIISEHSGQTLIKCIKIANVIIGWLLKKQKNTEWLKCWRS
jgi:ATP-dependent Clp protease protease subunit